MLINIPQHAIIANHPQAARLWLDAVFATTKIKIRGYAMPMIAVNFSALDDVVMFGFNIEVGVSNCVFCKLEMF